MIIPVFLRRRFDLLPLALLIILTTVFLFPVLFLGKTYFLRDILYLFHPWRVFCSENIQRGLMPLWNPYSDCGMPFMANWQSAVFYPPNIFFYFFSFPYALKAFHFLQLIFCGFFAYLFGRRLGLRMLPAAGMMILFTFNGFTLVNLEFLGYIATLSWTFALFLFIETPLLLALTVACSFFAGHQIMFLQLIMLLILFAFTLRRRPALSTLSRYAFATALAAGLCAMQMLPTAELVQHSARGAEGINYSSASAHALAWNRIVSIVSPLFTSGLRRFSSGETLHWDSTVYVGVFGFIAAIVGLFRARISRALVFALVLALAGILLSLGDSGLIYPWLYAHVPFFNLIRYPVKFMYLAVTGLVILLGIGLSRMRKVVAALFIGGIVFELMCTSWNFQPLAPNSFFTVRSKLTAYFQEHARFQRFLLSPGAENDRVFKGKNIAESWQSARGTLYQMTSMPYHIYNAFGLGDPLRLAPTERYVDEAYRQKPANLRPYLETMGIGYLATRQLLPVSASGLSLATQDHVFVYQVDADPKMYASSSKAATVDVSRPEPGLIHAAIFSPEPHTFTWRENSYPGWKTFMNGNPVLPDADHALFRQWDLPAGSCNLYLAYHSPVFRWGLMLTLLCAAILFGFAILWLQRFFTEKTS